MSIIYWGQKQAPLTPEEVDGNFEYLEKKIVALQELLKEVPALSDIELKEGQLFFKGSDGGDLPPLKLPSWTPRGKWKKDTSYGSGDIVYEENCLYLCQSGCTNSPPSTGEHWALVFSITK